MRIIIITILAVISLILSFVILFRFKSKYRYIIIALFSIFYGTVFAEFTFPSAITELQDVYIYLSGIIFGLTLSFSPILFRYKRWLAIILVLITFLNLIFNNASLEAYGDIYKAVALPYEVEILPDKTIHKYRFRNDKIITIPSNLREAHNLLDSIYSKNSLSDTGDAIEHHFVLGMHLRNNWGLWNGETNMHEFMTDLGYTHPDAMSGYILDTYYKKRAQIRNGNYNDSIFYAEIVKQAE